MMVRDAQAALPHRAVTGGRRSPRGLDAICLWCTSIHIITFLLFARFVPAATARPFA